MQHQSIRNGVPAVPAPTFYITGRQPLRPGAVLLAIAVAAGLLCAVLFALGHTGHTRLLWDSGGAARSPNASSGAPPNADDKDDPNQVDTVVLGDPADAPVPARRGDHVSPVHPFVIVHLPRFGDQVGLIPNSPAGHLLYQWLAAFNQGSESALAETLAAAVPEAAARAEMDLRQQTGGFALLSAKEVQPGLLVFRLRDQTPSATEVLGTLQVQGNSTPPAIASFSLRAVPSSRHDSTDAQAPK